MKKFKLIDEFKGYVNKKDITNLDPRFLVSPSQNMLINDGERLSIRGGYSLVGAASVSLYPVLSSYDWNTSTGTELNLRKYNTTLEYYYASSWRTLSSALGASAELFFAEYWDSATEAKDLLLIVDGTPDLKMWSGGVTTFSSATVNTITKEGTNTWAQDRFLLAGTRQVIIGGITYTYTGGESTTTLTGVTPDPTAGGHSAGDVVVQALRTHSNLISASVDLDIIICNRNQAYYADYTKRDVYVSKNNDYTSVAFSSPRLPGEGALLTLDEPPVAFAVQEEDTYVGTRGHWYKTSFTLSADLTKERLDIKRLKNAPKQGPIHQSAVGNIKNAVIFVSRDLTIDTLGRVENVDTPQSLPLSDPIKAELLGYDVTVKPHIIFHQNKTNVSFPSEGKTLIYDHERGFWNPPQVLPVRRFAIIGGDLHGHSNAVPETYKLFDGTSDNTNPIQAIATFAYRNYGYRGWEKNFDEWLTEGYISSNTVITMTLKYEYGGQSQILQKEIEGDNEDILFGLADDNSLGKQPLGSFPLGTITDEVATTSKFRIKHDFKKSDFFEIQVQYETNDVDFQWELLAQGGNVVLSNLDSPQIKT